jgi:spore coat protein H
MSFHTATHPSSTGAAIQARVLVTALGGVLLVALIGVALALQKTVPGAATAARLDGDGLFGLTNVWKIRLTFTPDQWQAMEPKGGGGPFGRPGGPGGPRGGPGGPGGFGPGAELAPIFLNQGDANHDGKLAREEFSALGQKWFAAWDTNKTGKVDSGKIRAGLDAMLGSAGGRRPGGPGGGAGGPPLLGGNGKRNGLAGAMGVEYPYAHADLGFEGWLFQNVSVRYKGNNTYMTSRSSLKRPLKVDLNRGFKGRRLGGVSKLNLHNNVNDPGGMTEPLSYCLFRDAGVPAGRTAYAQVYFTVPGRYTNHYVGVYSIVENVDNNFTRSRFGTKRGALFKPVTRQVFEDMGDDWSAYQQTYGPKTPVFEDEAKRVIAFSKLVSHASDAEFAARLEEYLDLDEFARFMAVTAWLSNMDSLLNMGQNFYVYLHPKTQQFQFLPWDFDHSFGQFPMAGSADELARLSVLKPWSGQVRFLERVYKVEKFRRLYLARMKEFSETVFKPERIQRQVDELAAVLRPAVQEESAQLLARFDQVVAGKAIGGGGPGGGRPPFDGPGGGFGQTMKPIRSFVAVRAKSVNEQLAGKSDGVTLSPFGPGGPPGGGGPGGPQGRGGPGGFGPGMFLAQAFMTALNADEDRVVTQPESTRGFVKWFDSWNTDHGDALTELQLRAGINRDFSPFRGGPPPGLDFGPAPDGFGPPGGPDDF